MWNTRRGLPSVDGWHTMSHRKVLLDSLSWQMFSWTWIFSHSYSFVVKHYESSNRYCNSHTIYTGSPPFSINTVLSCMIVFCFVLFLTLLFLYIIFCLPFLFCFQRREQCCTDKWLCMPEDSLSWWWVGDNKVCERLYLFLVFSK